MSKSIDIEVLGGSRSFYRASGRVKNRPLFRTVLIAAVSCLFGAHAQRVSAHGMSSRVIQGGIGVQAEYDHGQPMAGAEARVYAPDEPDVVWQKGVTDPNGVFMFFPNRDGIWRVTVDDGMGHKVETLVSSSDVDLAVGVTSTPHIHWEETVLGVLILFLLFGLYAVWRRTKKGRA